MAKLGDSLNAKIFAALKVAEKAKDACPLFLIGNPGTGKTATVNMFAKVRLVRLKIVHKTAVVLAKSSLYSNH